MTCRSRSPLLLSGVALSVSLALLPAAAAAGELPPIRTSATNQVAACATPGRLMAFLKQRNPKLDARFDSVGSHYMRHGEALGVRWDYAFFQMILETGHLTYSGDVKSDQNNFAGLGATGKGARGERFPDIGTGVRAHIEHLVMYSGERVASPVAERTRNVQDWGVLTSWQQGFSRPITFRDLAQKWAPTSRRYARDIQAIATRFFEGPCREADPQPELVAEIRGSPGGKAAKAGSAARPPATTPGVEAKQRAVAAAEAEGGVKRSALGAPPAKGGTLPIQPAADAAAAGAQADTTPPQAKAQTASMSPSVTLLNPTPSEAAPAEESGSAAAAEPAEKIEVAALPGGSLGQAGAADAAQKKNEQAQKKAPAAPTGSCRVWTASYGGTKAIIIKAVQDTTTNYTVLDVNEGAEKREADAYINAYAKGGQQVGEFASQSQALEKAFELCPEG